MKKLFIGTGTLLIIVLIIGYTTTWYCAIKSYSFIRPTFSLVSGIDPNSPRYQTASKIAVITPPVDRKLRRLQQETAEKLQEQLAKSGIAFDAKHGKSNWKVKTPQVKVYADKQAAIKDGFWYLVTVEPKDWWYSFLPMSRNWRAEMVVRGGPYTAFRNGKLGPQLVKNSKDIGFAAGFQGSGTTKGIFSLSKLTSEVAEQAAQSVCQDISENMQAEIHSLCTSGTHLKKNATVSPAFGTPMPVSQEELNKIMSQKDQFDKN